MSPKLIARKQGMVQVFDSEGKRVVCTVLLVEPNTILHVKTKETDGYDAIQLGGISLSESQAKKVSKPLKGHFKKAGVPGVKVIRESRTSEIGAYQAGQKIGLSAFEGIRFVDVEGQSKGKGYQGVMKLHNMSGGPAAHGSGFHRHMGSTGMRSTPGRCFPNGKRASRMGGNRVTLQNLRVVSIENDVLLVEGAVPGAKSSIVYIREAKKRKAHGNA